VINLSSLALVVYLIRNPLKAAELDVLEEMGRVEYEKLLQGTFKFKISSNREVLNEIPA
jgi:hypothetical protein